MQTVSGNRFERNSGQDRTRATMANDDHVFPITLKPNRDATASQLSHDFYVTTVNQVLRVTVSRRFLERGLLPKPAVSVPHTSANRKAHLV